MLNALIRQMEIEKCIFTAKDVWQQVFSAAAPASEYVGCPVCYPSRSFNDELGWSLNSFGFMVKKGDRHIVVAQHDIISTIYQARLVGSSALTDGIFRLATSSGTFTDYRNKGRLIEILLEGFDPGRHKVGESRGLNMAEYA